MIQLTNYTRFQIIIYGIKKCPNDCEHYNNTENPYSEICYLDNGTFEVKDDLLIKCPIGKW